MAVILQKIEKHVDSDLQRAIRYYSLLCAANEIKLSRRQLELLAFIAVKGNISSPAARREFVEMFNSSLASLENIKGKLVKKGWLVEIDRKYRVNPKINMDFSKDILLQINLLGHE
jgi:chromosome segregation and condensation protein ScpB